MSSADRAAALRAEADALDALTDLELELAAAKQAYEKSPSAENRARRDEAMNALREARAESRSDAVSVGGDAYTDEQEV